MADLVGWRAVYLVSAVLSLALVGLLVCVRPRHRSSAGTGNYGAALHSVPMLFLREPVLLLRYVLAFLISVSFSTFSTAVVLPLCSPPFSYSQTWIDLFGLAGLAGTTAAADADRLADQGYGQWTTIDSLMLLLAS